MAYIIGEWIGGFLITFVIAFYLLRRAELSAHSTALRIAAVLVSAACVYLGSATDGQWVNLGSWLAFGIICLLAAVGPRRQSINGWLRLWLVLSALWITVCVLVSGAELGHKPSASEAAEQTLDYACTATFAGSKMRIDKAYSKGDILKITQGIDARTDLSADLKDSVKACSTALQRDYVAERREQVQSFVAGALTIMIVPCTVLFILGWAIAWIRRGFRGQAI